MPDPKKQRAGRKGGQTVSKDRAHMAAIGRKGGQRSRVKRTTPASPVESNMPTHERTENERTEMDHTNDGHTRQANGHHAVELLKADHAHVHSLYEDYETAGGEDKYTLAEKIIRELEAHAVIEEEIFYPALQEKADKRGKDLVREAFEEHKAIKGAIRELRDMDPEQDSYESKFHDLMQDVEHHVGEEEGEMLPVAEEVLGDALEELGADMEKRKHELLETLTAGAPQR
jgi:general stress protein YciG